jgi:hypothetical protein
MLALLADLHDAGVYLVRSPRLTVRVRWLDRWRVTASVNRFPEGTVRRFWLGKLFVVWRRAA